MRHNNDCAHVFRINNKLFVPQGSLMED